MGYTVTFTQHYVYDIDDAGDENEAYKKAYMLFYNEMHYPVANTHYDEVDVEEWEDEDE